MFSPPPFLASYTAPGFPLVWEPLRPAPDEFFPFATPDVKVNHWPDFCPKGEADRMLAYVKKIDSKAQLIDVLHTSPLPPGVGHYPVPLQPIMEGGDVSVWGILGEKGVARIYTYAGSLADIQPGLRSGLETQYVNKAGLTWNNFGQIVSGNNAWPWDTLYTLVNPTTPDLAFLYWGNVSTGPILG